MSCLSIEQLYALAQNQLPAGEAERIRLHLHIGCKVCRKQLDQLEKILAATTSHELLKPPDWLMHRAMSLFTWNKTSAREDRLKRIPAILLVDTFAEGRLLGFRGARPMTRQMFYRAGEYDIDLSIDYIEPTRAVDIMGQAMSLSADWNAVTGANVKLLKESILTFDTKTNQYGEFILDGIHEGRYDLKLELKDKAIDIVGLDAAFCSD